MGWHGMAICHLRNPPSVVIRNLSNTFRTPKTLKNAPKPPWHDWRDSFGLKHLPVKVSKGV
eukprot:6189357-Lingulodinium_polyedra.AAC.1